jgi:uncharacterized protein
MVVVDKAEEYRSVTLVLALLAGGAFGFVVSRGGFCFHSTWRGLLAHPPSLDLVRAYVLLLVVATPVVQLLEITGTISPFVPPLAWKANLVGGAIFGVGMVLASSCVTGLFYKLGEGMLGAVVGLAAWAVGDIVTYRGFLSGLRDDLNADPITRTGSAVTVGNLGGAGEVLATVAVIAAGVATIVWLVRSPRTDRRPLWAWPLLGVATAAVIVGGWVLAAADDQDYPFGTSGVPTRVWAAIVDSDTAGSWWIPISLGALTLGGAAAATFSGTRWVRGETFARFAQLAGGGFVMGVGAAIAGGCNLGHAMVGVPLLSVGSIVSTLAMIAGVALADRGARLLPWGNPLGSAP